MCNSGTMINMNNENVIKRDQKHLKKYKVFMFMNWIVTIDKLAMPKLVYGNQYALQRESMHLFGQLFIEPLVYIRNYFPQLEYIN